MACGCMTAMDNGGGRLHGLAWGLAGVAALVMPWLLGGRTPLAPWVGGWLCWGAAGLVLLGAVADYRAWRPTAEYERRRGVGSPNPLGVLGRGLLWTLPLWAFILMLWISLLNPAYAWEGEALVRRDFVTWLPTLINPERSGPGIFLMSGLLAAAGLLANPACRLGRCWRRWILAALLVNAMVLCWTGIYFRFAGNGLVLGRFEPRAGYFFASFYYKNHWAAYAILYCGVAAAFFFRDLPRWFANARRAGAGGLALLAIFFLGLTFPVADSRSGILLFALFGAACLAGLYRRMERPAGRRLVALAGLAVLAAFAVLSANELHRSWERTESQVRKAGSVLRFDGIRAQHAPEVCLAMLQARPVWGWGYLSYDPLFPVFATDYFRDAEGELTIDMEFAHNDWLQGLAEFGLAGSLLLGLAVAGLSVNLARRRGHPIPPREHHWILIGIALVGLLAAWDFPLSNPAVLVTVLVLGLLAIKGGSYGKSSH